MREKEKKYRISSSYRLLDFKFNFISVVDDEAYKKV